MTDLGAFSQEVTIIVRIDTGKARDNVAVDLGSIPPVMALDALRQAYESLAMHQEYQSALLVFRSQVLEPVHAVDDDE